MLGRRGVGRASASLSGVKLCRAVFTLIWLLDSPTLPERLTVVVVPAVLSIAAPEKSPWWFGRGGEGRGGRGVGWLPPMAWLLRETNAASVGHYALLLQTGKLVDLSTCLLGHEDDSSAFSLPSLCLSVGKFSWRLIAISPRGQSKRILGAGQRCCWQGNPWPPSFDPSG